MVKPRIMLTGLTSRIIASLIHETFVDDQLYRQRKSVWCHSERLSIKDQDNSKIREKTSPVSEESLNNHQMRACMVIRMAHCEISCQKTKYFEKNERISCFNLGLAQYRVTSLSLHEYSMKGFLDEPPRINLANGSWKTEKLSN